MTAVLERPLLSEPAPDPEPTEPDSPSTPETRVSGKLILPGRVVQTWDTRDEVSVAQAKAAFDDIVEHGGMAYKTEGATSEVIRTFDPSAESIVASRPMAGG